MIYIGIDPDMQQNGVCCLNKTGASISFVAGTKTNAQLYDMLQLYATKYEKPNIQVTVEAGWLNRSNWHLTRYDNVRTAAAKGYDVGCNHQRGKDIVEWCQHNGYKVQEQKPLVKVWQTADGKVSVKELQSIVGQYGIKLPKPCPQDMRDAILLTWLAAGLPIRVMPSVSKQVYDKSQKARQAAKKHGNI